MKNVWTAIGKSIISQITAIITKILVLLALQALATSIWGGAANVPAIIAAAIELPIGNKGNTNTGTVPDIGTSTTVNNVFSSNTVGKKLDKLIKAIEDFEPVQTQVIDLPTLARSNRIGNAMILQGS